MIRCRCPVGRPVGHQYIDVTIYVTTASLIEVWLDAVSGLRHDFIRL